MNCPTCGRLTKDGDLCMICTMELEENIRELFDDVTEEDIKKMMNPECSCGSKLNNYGKCDIHGHPMACPFCDSVNCLGGCRDGSAWRDEYRNL